MLTFLHLVVASLSLNTSPILTSPPAPTACVQLATYVPICKNSRGVFDRRACGGKASPRRTQVA